MNKKNIMKIYELLSPVIKDKDGIFAVMGNMASESAMRPDAVEYSFLKKKGMTKEAYWQSVESGKHNFITDAAGVGLCQWTYRTRKEALQKMAKKQNKKIYDASLQVDFLMQELKTDYKLLLQVLEWREQSLDYKTKLFMLQYERPAIQSLYAIKTRQAMAVGIKDIVLEELMRSAVDLTDLTFYPSVDYSGSSIVDALKLAGEKDTSKKHREKIALVNGISNYSGSSEQNLNLLEKLKAGRLLQA